MTFIFLRLDESCFVQVKVPGKDYRDDLKLISNSRSGGNAVNDPTNFTSALLPYSDIFPICGF